MKRNTWILLLVAAGLGAFVYFYEIKDGKPRDEKEDTSKPAFSFKQEDIAAITMTRQGETVTLEQKDGKWGITQPVAAAADESTVTSLVSSLANARVERALPATEENLKSYGLAEPPVTLDIKLNSGEQHKLELGNKDFSGLSVYGQLNDANEVALLPASVLTSADKSLNDLRDRSVLGASTFEIQSVDLTNENGQLGLAKKDSDWVLTKPSEMRADQSEVNLFLNGITSAKATEYVNEANPDLAKYGLDKPKITLKVQLQGGGERTLLVGSEVDGDYYAKSSDRAAVFKIPADAHTKLNIKPAELRDRTVVDVEEGALQKVEVKNSNLTLVAEKAEDKWVIKEPADKKDKEANDEKFIDPLEDLRALEIIDKPEAKITSKLAKPPVTVKLTGKDGKTTELSVSEADGDNVYVQVKGRAGVYKLHKRLLDELSFKADDVVKQ